jgi:hypothetical protein
VTIFFQARRVKLPVPVRVCVCARALVILHMYIYICVDTFLAESGRAEKLITGQIMGALVPPNIYIIYIYIYDMNT